VLKDVWALSWSEDKTLRLWDIQSGACLKVLAGHTNGIDGALAMIDGRVLSWSGDKTLRVWDVQSGTCLKVLEGHGTPVAGALALSDGRVLSWSFDERLRLWDVQSGACLKVLEGHTKEVIGAAVLSDGRILSWSEDRTLRLWDSQSGACLKWWWGKALRSWDGRRACLKVLEGHTEAINGAAALRDGRILSWSDDETLRLWDGQSGACLKVFKGHTNRVAGAVALSDGRILSWSWGGKKWEWRLWDGQSGASLEGVSEREIPRLQPQWLHLRTEVEAQPNVLGIVFLAASVRFVRLYHKLTSEPIAQWHADSEEVGARCLLTNGTAVVTQVDGQVCLLKLHRGNRRISLAEAEAILAERKNAD
jgi:WD40 repeat protein